MTQLIVNIKKLRHNIHFLVQYCDSLGLEIMGILKGPGIAPPIILELISNGIDNLGFSDLPVERLHNNLFIKKPVLITLPSIHEISDMIQYFGTSLNSQISVIKKINDSLIEQNRSHNIILMVDAGDLREGVQPESVLGVVKQIHEIKDCRLKFLGIGTNLGCCAGMIPNEQNINTMQELAIQIESQLDIPVKTVSIGGSVFLEWLKTNRLPDKINQIRLGEAILLGNIPTIDKKHKDLYDDVFILRSDVLEISEKRVDYSNNLGKDALGNKHEFKYTGMRKRAIMNFGISATYPLGLQSLTDGLDIVSVNSNYTIIDYTNSQKNLKPGDFVDFKLNYLSLLQSIVSPLTNIVYWDQRDK